MSKDRNRRVKALAALIIWGVSLASTVVTLSYHLLQDIESKTWDWRIRLIARTTTPDPRIKIIMIDQDSIDRFAQEEKIYWPWPRSVYAPVLSFLKRAGAKGIAFDMLFTEQQTHVEDDFVFAEAIGSTIPVVSALTLNTRAVAQPDAESLQALKQLQSRQDAFEEVYLYSPSVKSFEGASVPIHTIIERSAAVGAVNEDFDPDRIFRRVSAGGRFKGIPFLTLPFAFHHLMKPDAEPRAYLQSVEDPRGKYLIKFRGPAQTYPWYTIDSIISSAIALENGTPPLVDPVEFKDAFVLLGPSASALLDLRPGPFPGLFPGVEVHATTFDNLLNRDFLREATFVESVGAAAGILLLIVLTSMFFVRFQVLLLGALFVLWIVACFGVGLLGVWLPMVNPLVGMIVATIASVAFQYQLEGKQYKFIRNAFQYYVTPEVIDSIVEDPSALALGGERRELSIFFSDIEGFTSLSESMEPSQLVQFLNKFLTEMTEIILSYGGTIDKYEGDAIIAFWNAPLPVKDHRGRAVSAAIQCQLRLRELADFFQQQYQVRVRMRVGVNTGCVTVGNFGSTTRFNYTMIGDAANLASRVEGVNKLFGTSILVTEETKNGAESLTKWRKVGTVAVVGRTQSTTLWEPISTVLHSNMVEHIPAYNEGIEWFEAMEIGKAKVIFERLAPVDSVSAAYLKRIESEMNSDNDSPIWSLTSK